LSTTLRSVQALAREGLLDPKVVAELAPVEARYAVAVTAHIAEGISGGSEALRRQFVPTRAELRLVDGERADPIGDDVHEVVPGVVHRYPDRVLLKPVHVCPVYCRFCFRRESVGPKGLSLDTGQLDRAVAWIAAQDGIFEVILTGGDPLVLSPSRLGALVARLSAIPHVGVVRVHTRVPVVAPQRVTPDLVSALQADGAATWVAVHTNHPDELTPPARSALARLVDAGLPLVSQTVLLKGINDDVDTLTTLFRQLVRCRVKPYYLHHGDLAPGTAHLRTSLERGRALVARLRGRLSGLCQPTYVLDIPGGHGKVPAAAAWVESAGEGGWTVRDWQGQVHAYPPTSKVP